ncbi:hypothetical protein LEMLEM_LOCUS7881 [Lemmus lemmus]
MDQSAAYQSHSADAWYRHEPGSPPVLWDQGFLTSLTPKLWDQP